VINAVRRSGIPIKDQKLVFMGAGSAGVGVAQQILEFFVKSGIEPTTANKMFWLVDSKVTHFLLCLHIGLNRN
jgi:malate dehydrogenase (oxaloacetate-decarboxylating)(NADP+)